MRYRPLLSDNTMTVIFVFAFRACTKAAREGAPSGPATVPAMVAPEANEAKRTTALIKPRVFISLDDCIRPPRSLCHGRTCAKTQIKNQVSKLQCRRGYQTRAPAVYGDSRSRY